MVATGLLSKLDLGALQPLTGEQADAVPTSHVDLGAILPDTEASGIVVSPAVALGHAVAPRIQRSQKVTPAAAFGLAVTPRVARVVQVSPAVAQALTTVVSVNGETVLVVAAAVALGLASPPLITRTAPAGIATALGVALSPTVLRTQSVSPATAQGLTPAPVIARTIRVSPAVAQAIAVVPMSNGSIMVQPAPAVALGLTVSPAQVNRTVPAAPAVAQGLAVSPQPLVVVTVLPATSNAVAVSPSLGFGIRVSPAVGYAVALRPSIYPPSVIPPSLYSEMARRIRTAVKDYVVTPLGLTAVDWPNLPFAVPDPGGKWVRVRVEHDQTVVASTGSTKRYRKQARAVVSVFVSVHRLDTEALDIASSVATALRSQTIDEVRYLEPFVQTRGRVAIPNAGAWWRVDVTCPCFLDDREQGPDSVAPFALATETAASAIVRSRFKAEVQDPNSLLVSYDNDPTHPSSPNTTWIAFAVTYGGTARQESGAGGFVSSNGIATAAIFVPVGQGDTAGLALADLVVGRFRSVVDRGVSFGTPSLRSHGREGPWWRLDVQVPFATSSAP